MYAKFQCHVYLYVVSINRQNTATVTAPQPTASSASSASLFTPSSEEGVNRETPTARQAGLHSDSVRLHRPCRYQSNPRRALRQCSCSVACDRRQTAPTRRLPGPRAPGPLPVDCWASWAWPWPCRRPASTSSDWTATAL